jgi:hypothetical protein
MTGQKIQTGKANENGDVGERHYRLKRALNQALLLRGSRVRPRGGVARVHSIAGGTVECRPARTAAHRGAIPPDGYPSAASGHCGFMASAFDSLHAYFPWSHECGGQGQLTTFKSHFRVAPKAKAHKWFWSSLLSDQDCPGPELLPALSDPWSPSSGDADGLISISELPFRHS